jgi:ribosomal RNA-processing protein 8
MFSVPGWSITASLKTQTGPATVPSLPTGNGASADGGSKKRKRKDGEGEDGKAKKPKSEKAVKGTEKAQKRKKGVEAERPETASKKEKKDKKEKAKEKQKQKPKGTGSNTVDLEAGAAARAERNKKKAEEETAVVDGEPKQQADGAKDVKPRKKDKGKKEKMDAEHEEMPVLSSSTKSKSEKKVQKKAKDTSAASTETTIPPPSTPKLTPLQAQMQAKLASARFRYLNETLYTSNSSTAFGHFKKDPGTFEEYHAGFRQQVDVWPSNPVDEYISDIKKRAVIGAASKGGPKDAVKGLPRTHGTCTVADLGCGDAKLAATLSKEQGKLNVKVLSFDLHNPSPLVQRADISNLPLEDGSVNIAIFCLALMGTNWPDFIDEAYRILHWKGELWVAEIKSRFGRVEGKKDGKNKVVEHSVGNRKKKPRSRMSEAEKRREDGLKQDEDDTLAVEVDGVATSNAGRSGAGSDETDVSAFIKVLATRGFLLDGEESEAVERGNKMFVKMRFLKAAQPSKGKNVVKGKEGATWKPKGKKFLDGKGDEEVDEGKVLKPCVYKLR